MFLLVLALSTAAMLGPALRALRSGGAERRRAAIGLALVLVGVAALGLTAPDRQKMLTYLIMPTGVIWLGLVAVCAELIRRRERGLAAALGALTLLYTLAGNVLLGTLGLIGLQDRIEHVDWREGPAFDAVLVLGGGTKPNPEPARYALSQAGDRVLLGARLYRRGRTRKLVCSGRGVPGISKEDLTAATTAIWTELGIPEADIVRLKDPYNTKQEIFALAEAVRAHGWQRVGLISSAYHLPRAMALAARAGVEVVPLGADHHLGPDRFHVLALVPQRAGFGRTTTVLWEHLGRLVGR